MTDYILTEREYEEAMRFEASLKRVKTIKTDTQWNNNAFGSASITYSNRTMESIVYTMRAEHGIDLDRENGYKNLW